MTTLIAKVSKHPWQKNVWDRHHREFNGQNLYVLWQGSMTMVDCNKQVRLHKQQPTFFIDVDQPHQRLQRHKVPAIILIVMMQQQCQQRYNHFFLSYCKEQWQQQTNAREERNNSHTTIKYSCCRSQDATTTISRHAKASSANTPRSDLASTLEKAWKLPKASTVITPKTACMMPRARMVSTPSRPHLLRRATMSPLLKKVTANCCQWWWLGWVWRWASCHKDDKPCMLYKTTIASHHNGP
jgi:hypothetical protein